MYQQKQQKHSTSETQTFKDLFKIGLPLQKPLFPHIKTRSSSRSKSHHNLQQFTSPKKIKVPDIYYEQPTEPSKKKYLKPIITETNSLNELSIDLESNKEEKQQLVLKANFNTKPHENNITFCQKHAYIQQNQIQGVESRTSISRLNQKDNKNRQCCQIQPSEQGSVHNVKTKLNNQSHHNSLTQSTKNSPNKILQMKLKPIKTNFYQKPELFGPVPQKLLPPINRSQFQRYFISKNQEKAIVDKLSKPKHKIELPKKNCRCLNQSGVNYSLIPKHHNISSFDLREFNQKKIKINLEKLQNMNRKDSYESVDNCPDHGLKRKIKQKRNEIKKKYVHDLQRYDTEPFSSDKFMGDDEKVNDEHYAESECREIQNVFIPTRAEEEQQSFITGILKPSISKMEHQKKKRKLQTKDDGFGPKRAKKVSINIQTQDILIVKNQETHQINQSKTLKSSNLNIPFGDEAKNLVDRKKSYLSQSSIKDLQKISYTFGSRQISAKKVEKNENPNNSKVSQASRVEQFYAGKTRDQIIARCTFQRQYWVYYQIEKGLFHDLTKPFEKITVQIKPKINLVSSVFKQDIMIKAPAKQQKPTQKPSLDVSQISSIQNLERLNSFPVTIDIKESKKNQITETNSSLISKNRKCPSPSLAKSHINMFNRSPNSITSSRTRKCFRIPIESQYVNYIKNYKPLNSQIKITTLIQLDDFKVIPSVSQFFFGQIVEDSIKHGLGVEVTLNQIFEGEYINGNRKIGYLKVHDGVYDGTFENNLKHGHGIFRWDNGQVFEGQWKMGSKNGFGVWTSPDGSFYQGQWHLNMQHGKGKHVHFSGVYEGEFKNFRKQGRGKQSFPNGDNFIGNYKNGKPNGKGKYEWSNGTYYEGEFVDGLKEGKGTWHQNANTYYEGSFYKDQKHGQGTEYYKDGSYLEGIFINGVISEGKLYNFNKQVIKTYGTNLE